MKQDNIEILVLDDTRLIRTYLFNILSKAGYSVLCTKNYDEACEKLKNHFFNIVISDIILDDDSEFPNGFDFCEKVKNLNKITKVILFSGMKIDEESRVKAFEVGADDFLSKPISSKELIFRIKKLLRYQKNEIELKDAYEKTEFQVRERTKELTELNKELNRSLDEKNRIEEKLRKSEKRFKDLADLLPQGIFECDLEGKVLYVNKEVCNLFGYEDISISEIEGKSLFELCFPENEVKRAKQNIQKKLEGGYGLDPTEYTLLKKDGTKLPVLVYSSSIKEHGKAQGLRGIIMDMSARKKIEQKIKKQLIYNEILFKIASLAISNVDFNIFCNKCLKIIGENLNLSRAYIFKYKYETNTTDNTHEWTAKSVQPQITSLQDIEAETLVWWTDCLLKKHIINYNDINDIPDENVVEILTLQNIKSIVVVPIFVFNKYYGFIGFDECKFNKRWSKEEIEMLKTVCNIITGFIEQKKTEDKIIDANKALDKIIDLMPIGITIIDNKKIIQRANRSALELLGYSEEDELIGKNCTDTICPRERCPVWDEHTSLNCSEHILRKNDGTIIPVLKSAVVMDINNKLVIVSAFMDITERKKNAALLEKAKLEAEETSRFKSQFLANVSHEIRTPLNSIIGFSEMISQSFDLKQIHHNSDLILNEGEILLQLINDLLDNAKIEAGKMTIEKISFDLKSLVEILKPLIKKTADKKDLEYRVVFDENIPERIVGDKFRIRQVLINLLSNAVKFTKKGFVVLEITLIDNRQKIKFKIIDTGIGIEKEKKNKIFDAFFQTDSSNSRKFFGTGLGTNISKKFVNLMGGEIGFESEYKKGSTFFFTIPLEIPKNDYETRTEIKKFQKFEHNNEMKKNYKVLIVEDYLANQELIKQNLINLGIEVAIADSGSQAIILTQNSKFDLIFMDLQMPQMDGFETSMHIRNAVTENKNVPIIAATADAYVTTKSKCMKAGMNDVITKPIRKKKLIEILKKWLDYKEETDEQITSEIEKSSEKKEAPLNYDVLLYELCFNEQLAKKLIAHYISNSKQNFGLIEDYISKKEFKKLSEFLHKIKGGALNLTAEKLGDTIAIFEGKINNNETTNLLPLFESYKKEFFEFENYCMKELKITL